MVNYNNHRIHTHTHIILHPSRSVLQIDRSPRSRPSFFTVSRMMKLFHEASLQRKLQLTVKTVLNHLSTHSLIHFTLHHPILPPSSPLIDTPLFTHLVQMLSNFSHKEFQTESFIDFE